MPVDSTRTDYDEMRVKWSRLRDCFGGRDAILKAGVRYCPSLPAKDVAENQAYRERGNFYNAVKRTTEGMTGAIYQEPAEVEFPEAIKTYLDDITLTNIPFEMFSQAVGKEIMLVGRYGILTDMPPEPVTDGRPYCVGYCAEDIINWRTTRIGGDDMLYHLVLRERKETPDPKDPFVCLTVTQYRVLRLEAGIATVELYQEQEKTGGDREWISLGRTTLVRRGIALNFIPFVFICPSNVTPDLETPPLIDLADVNLGHWRNSVDYEYGLHLVALPTPWVAGAKNSSTEPLPIGPSKVWELDQGGHAGMLEFTGQGLASISTAMSEKKKQMATLGARLLEDSATVQETASAVRMRHAGDVANLRTIAGSIELGLSMVLQTVAWWTGTEDKPADTEASVELNKEYLNIKASSQDIQAALQSLQEHKISYATWYNILKTGGWTREGISPEDELKSIEAEIAEEKKNNPEPQPPVVPPKKKTITGPDGAVKYQVTEE